MNRKNCTKKDMCENGYICIKCVNFNNFTLKSTINDDYSMKIECPYCGEMVNIDHDDNGTETECGECEKYFNIHIEYNPSITATIIIGEFNLKD